MYIRIQASQVAQCRESICQCRRPRRRNTHKFDPWVGKTPWRRARQPTAVSLPGESHGQRSLAGYRPWSYKELDTTEQLTLSMLTIERKKFKSILSLFLILHRIKFFTFNSLHFPGLWVHCSQLHPILTLAHHLFFPPVLV